MQETWVRSLGWEDPLGKEMATHSSIPMEIPWTEWSLVGSSPWGHKRIRHDLVTKQQLSTNDPKQRAHSGKGMFNVKGQKAFWHLLRWSGRLSQDYCNGVIAMEETDGAQLQLWQGQVEIYSQGAEWRGRWMENYKEKTSKVGRVLLNLLNRILAESRPVWPDIKGDQKARVGVFSPNWLCRVPAKTGLGKDKM